MMLDGKVAVVTGGGRGIGRAVAMALSEAGCRVAVAARSCDQIETVASEIQQAGGDALPLVCDVSDRSAVDTTMEAAARQWGHIDMLVNNAGGGLERHPVGDDDPDTWRQVIDINLTGTYYCCRAALPHLRACDHGKIINVGSGMGHQPRPGNSSYNCAKAAVWMFTRCLALECWKHKIAVNEIVPGPVYTELTAGIFELDQPHPSIESEHVKRPEDVVPIAMFLATQGENGPTGQSFSLARRPL